MDHTKDVKYEVKLNKTQKEMKKVQKKLESMAKKVLLTAELDKQIGEHRLKFSALIDAYDNKLTELSESYKTNVQAFKDAKEEQMLIAMKEELEMLENRYKKKVNV